MSYDLRGAWESVTGHHTTTRPHSEDDADTQLLTVVSKNNLGDRLITVIVIMHLKVLGSDPENRRFKKSDDLDSNTPILFLLLLNKLDSTIA